jgi:hypothetical protein
MFALQWRRHIAVCLTRVSRPLAVGQAALCVAVVHVHRLLDVAAAGKEKQWPEELLQHRLLNEVKALPQVRTVNSCITFWICNVLPGMHSHMHGPVCI